MTTYESYHAVADAGRAQHLAASTSASPFTIEVRFVGGLTDEQQAAFTAAADRWTTMIVGDLPPVVAEGDTIDDVLILAQGTDIDGPGGVLGQAGPTILRPASAGAAALLPAKGIMSFDSADLAQMQANGTLNDVITHEMGHVLGIGTVWQNKGLLRGGSTNNPTFTGPAAMAEWAELLAAGGPQPVPVENTGGVGTRNGHWRESVFRNELMSGFIDTPGNPISRVTVASLGDLGYVVDLDAAEPYQLPDLAAAAAGGDLVSHTAPIGRGVMISMIPRVLPDDALA